ncbi:hypothetical protein [Intestinibacillus massiliensis]|uniref:hypothetical protein n=1 Tax=Intestinibacillus massiliensis TaxID=1871029 RepID=UPI000B355150|nr:hypothetical protein [Intestinibacillus massiliensis]
MDGTAKGNTANDIYMTALSMMYENTKNTKDYDPYLFHVLNMLLAENFDLNNTYCQAYGKEPLEAIPYITSKQDVIPYEPVFWRMILPFGLAAHFFMDDSMSKHADFFAQYNNARVDAERAVITSYYVGEDG